MSFNPELLQAYNASHYRMALPLGACILQIGAPAPLLDDYMRAQQCRQSVFISAHNPGSRLLPAAINHTRHAALEQILIARRLHRLASVGYATPAMPDWPEEHGFLVLDISTEFACALGRLFGQHAVLLMMLNQPVQLLHCHN